MKVVTGNTARNPIARAIARQRVHNMLLSAKLRMFVLDDGVDDSPYLGGVLSCLAVVSRACELQWPDKGGSSTMAPDVRPDYNVLRGACSALVAVLHRWDSAQAIAIEQGIERAERLNKLLKTEHVYDASLEIGLRVERAR